MESRSRMLSQSTLIEGFLSYLGRGKLKGFLIVDHIAQGKHREKKSIKRRKEIKEERKLEFRIRPVHDQSHTFYHYELKPT